MGSHIVSMLLIRVMAVVNYVFVLLLICCYLCVELLVLRKYMHAIIQSPRVWKKQ